MSEEISKLLQSFPPAGSIPNISTLEDFKSTLLKELTQRSDELKKSNEDSLMSIRQGLQNASDQTSIALQQRVERTESKVTDLIGNLQHQLENTNSLIEQNRNIQISPLSDQSQVQAPVAAAADLSDITGSITAELIGLRSEFSEFIKYAAPEISRLGNIVAVLKNTHEQHNLEKLKENLATRNLQLKRVRGDGNCFFRAVADQVYNDEERHQEIRDLACEFIRNNFRTMLIGEEDVNQYVEKMSSSGEWADETEVAAVCGALRINIRIFPLTLWWLLQS
eukprot:TRINITY_DN3879_c0_g1_i2.p1 TRINITY_DN3879_c0_g1~~TRINITY_DN3879_c0_g1_i2.p1  ORF type:complete len:280 (+),score=38.54 TRINITY_DN3879_c0_g1_i2:377-1216(+)